MIPDGNLKLVGEVRDFQIIDINGKRCGIVDDIEFAGTPGQKLKLKALLVGPGIYKKRVPRWLASIIVLIAGDKVVKVSWKEVERITACVELKGSAESYGLGRTERYLEQLLARIPGATS